MVDEEPLLVNRDVVGAWLRLPREERVPDLARFPAVIELEAGTRSDPEVRFRGRDGKGIRCVGGG